MPLARHEDVRLLQARLQDPDLWGCVLSRVRIESRNPKSLALARAGAAKHAEDSKRPPTRMTAPGT
jgi:hypothetical protein